MRIVLDERAGVAHGECVLAAADLFALEDGEDVAQVLRARRHAAPPGRAGRPACPALAIRVEG
jgi:ferredoxin